jgi:hypothetical protein
MILYVNGCSHSAAAEAAVNHAWACDDGNLWPSGDEPHPANLAVSYGQRLADSLGMELICQASSGGSNSRTMRTTVDWIEHNRHRLEQTFMVLQWTTWEREEWFHQDKWYQVNASGIDNVPPALVDRYKNYVVNIDWSIKIPEAHEQIWRFHLYLKALGIRHLMFNAFSSLDNIYEHCRKVWEDSYVEPYSENHSYHNVLKSNGFDYVTPKGYHFGQDGHRFWAQYLLQYIKDHQLLGTNEIPLN